MNDVDSNKVISNDVAENITDNDKPKLTGNIEDYKLIIDLTKDMKKTLNDAREQIQNALKSEGFIIPDVLEDIVILDNTDIDNDDITKLKDYLKDHLINKDDYDIKYESLSDDDIRDKIKEIRNTFIYVHSIEKEYYDIINDSKDILEEYFNYINSNRVEDSLKKRLELMKSMEDIDDNKNSKNNRMIKILEKTLDLSFMTDNFNVDRMVDSFFKDNLSSYVVSRYKNKIAKFGYNEDIYIHFLDIEETFLEDKYHPFNNLFLFIYMRFVGHADPYRQDDGLYVRSITGSIANLIYHRFDTTEHEKEFINFIKSIIDKFIDAEYTDRFIMDNTSYKNNESNIRARQVLEDQKRDLVIRKLDYYGIEYNDDMSLDELMQLFDDKYNEFENKVLESSDDEDKKIIDAINNATHVDKLNTAIDNIKNSENKDTFECEDIKNERSENEPDEREYEPAVESEQLSTGNNEESDPE